VKSRLVDKYKNEIAPALMKEFNYKNVMQIPRLEKITLNVCTSDAITNSKIMPGIAKEIGQITNQKAVLTKAKKSVSNFKLRKGMIIGSKVTLRRNNMNQFFDKLISATIPSIKDFRGLSPKSFDKRGNYSFGIKEQIVFPEIEYDKIDKIRGLSIVITTSAKTDKEAKRLLEGYGFPFSGSGSN
jgi:large subunit ribosomal protein L5